MNEKSMISIIGCLYSWRASLSHDNTKINCVVMLVRWFVDPFYVLMIITDLIIRLCALLLCNIKKLWRKLW